MSPGSESTDEEEEEGSVVVTQSTTEERVTSPRVLEIDFVQPTPGLDLGLVERRDEASSNGTAALATGFVIAFVVVLMITVGVALNVCR